MKEKTVTDGKITLNAPDGSIIKEAEEIVERNIEQGIAHLLERKVDYQGCVASGEAQSAAYGITLTYVMCPVQPIFDIDGLNEFRRKFVSDNLSEKGVKRDAHLSRIIEEDSLGKDFRIIGCNDSFWIQFGSLNFQETVGQEIVKTTQRRSIMLNPSLITLVENEHAPNAETTSDKKRVNSIENTVRFLFYPSREIALKKIGDYMHERDTMPTEDFRRQRFFKGNYKEGDIQFLEFNKLTDSQARLQSAEEVAAFRVLSHIGKPKDEKQSTRTVGFYFKDKGKWYIAFDDSSNPHENPIYAMNREWNAKEREYPYGPEYTRVKERLIISRNAKIAKGLVERARASGRVVCLEGIDPQFAGGQITRAVLGNWAKPYELYLSELNKEVSESLEIKTSAARHLEKSVGKDNLDIRMVTIGEVNYYHEGETNGGIIIGDRYLRELRGFGKLPEGMK